MSGFDISLEKVLSKGELQKALAIIFNIQSENVVVDDDYDSDPFTGDIKIWAIINQLKLVEKKTISSKGYTQSDGSPIKNPNINEYIFKKK